MAHRACEAVRCRIEPVYLPPYAPNLNLIERSKAARAVSRSSFTAAGRSFSAKSGISAIPFSLT